MKKIISIVAVFCMLISMTAFAATTDAVVSMSADKTTAKAGETITYTVSITADSTGYGLSNAALALYYDPAKIEFDTSSIVYLEGNAKYNKMQFTNKPNTTTPTDTFIQLQCTASKASGDSFVVGAVDIFKFTGTVKEGATGKIDFRIKTSTFKVSDYNTTSISATLPKITNLPEVVIAGDDPTPSKPVITLDPSNPVTGENNGIVDINTNAETGAYSVKVTAPIGKKAVIYIDGVAQPGSEIADTATKDITIKVAYEDVTDEVITYVVPMSSIYGAEDGIAAFGKGTIAEGVEYGIKFGGLTGTYKGITDYKFPATGNVGGIFGVEVKDAPAGDYTAQAYVGDAMGAAIDFTK